MPPAPLPSEGTISVRLASGRTFTAALDARTDATQLWLRFQQAGAEVLRPIEWDRVASAEVAGQKLSGDELHAFGRAVAARDSRLIPPWPGSR